MHTRAGTMLSFASGNCVVAAFAFAAVTASDFGFSVSFITIVLACAVLFAKVLAVLFRPRVVLKKKVADYVDRDTARSSSPSLLAGKKGDADVAKLTFDRSADLLPGMTLEEQYIDEAVHNGFVEQIGPNCAAAAVAGAMNALTNTSAESISSYSQMAVMAVYSHMIQQKLDTKIAKLRKTWKDHDIKPLLDLASIPSLFEVRGALSKFRPALQGAIERSLGNLAAEDHPSALTALLSNMESDSVKGKLMVKEMQETTRLKWALWKLEGLPKPCTAPIGSDRVATAVKALAASANLKVQVATLLAKSTTKLPCRRPVSSEDDEDTVDSQWDAIVSSIKNPKHCLLFHLRNHYALVAGYRIITCSDGTKYRQILCSHRGQKPKSWMDMHCSWLDVSAKTGKEIPRWGVRDTVLKWKGYKLTLIQLRDDRYVDANASTIEGYAEVVRQWVALNGHQREYRGPSGDTPDNGPPSEDEAEEMEQDMDD